jgi:hypothetical protein
MERLYCDENMKTEEQFRAHHLYKFLYQHGLFGSFLKNTLGSPHSVRKNAAYEFLQGKIDCITFLERVGNIDLAFIWINTLEGETFWYNLHLKEYNSHCKQWTEYQKITKKH